MSAPVRSGADLGVFDWPRWEDLRFPAQAIDPVGLVAPPTRDANTGLLVFSGTSDNAIAGTAQMPHAWRGGTPIRPHLHLRFTTSASANTRWAFEYDISNVNGNFTFLDGVWGTPDIITVANPANVYKSVVAGFSEISMAGFRESAQLVWRLSRYAFSDAADTDTNGCVLLEFDIHYQVDKSGTVVEYPT